MKSIADKLRDAPQLDHSLLSPSGRISARARKAAMDRHFGGENAITMDDIHRERLAAIQPKTSERLRREAARLRDFAAHGMRPRAYPKLAAQLEAKADAAEATGD